jgi:AraC-like DNA-binding protein
MENEIVSASLPNTLAHIECQSFAPGDICRLHVHDEVELLKVSSGKLKCVVGDDEHVLLPDQVLFINSRVPHYTSPVEGNTEQIFLQFRIDNFIDDSVSKIGTVLARFSEYTDRQSCVINDCAELCQYLDIIQREFFEKNVGYEEYIKAGIYSTIGYLTRHHVIENHNKLLENTAIIRLMPALEYIDKNYSKEISLEEISGILNLNQFYFCRLFKSAVGSSFCEYLNFVRISKSEKLFKDKGKNIMDISLDVGFSSVSYFNRVFRKIKGCTPSAYKKAQNA